MILRRGGYALAATIAATAVSQGKFSSAAEAVARSLPTDVEAEAVVLAGVGAGARCGISDAADGSVDGSESSGLAGCPISAMCMGQQSLPSGLRFETSCMIV